MLGYESSWAGERADDLYCISQGNVTRQRLGIDGRNRGDRIRNTLYSSKETSESLYHESNLTAKSRPLDAQQRWQIRVENHPSKDDIPKITVALRKANIDQPMRPLYHGHDTKHLP
jgi:hypothetical protein